MGDDTERKQEAPRRPAGDATELEELRAQLRRLEKLVREQRADQAPTSAIQQRVRDIVDSRLLGIITWDIAGDILDANDAFLELAGYTRADLLAGRVCWERITPPEYLELDRATAEQLAHTGRCRAFEKEYVRGDGSRVPVLVNAELIDAERGLGVSFILDLTERTRHEARVARQQLLDSLGAMIGGTAHDFNNLLTTIVCNAALALRQLTADDPLRANLLQIQQASVEAAELCAQMQAYAAPAMAGDFVELDLGQLAQDVCDRARPTMASGVTLELDTLERDIHVTVQQSQLETVILALLANACEAMPNGGSISVATSIGRPADTVNGLASSSAQGSDHVAILTVRDAGAGMDRDTARRMFDPFFSTKFLGRGMSLAAADGIIRAHGGSIEVDSSPGAGTAVRILLPLTDSVH